MPGGAGDPEPDARTPASWSRRERLAAVLVLVLGLLLVFHTQISTGFRRAQVMPLDPLFQNYVLEYDLRYLAGATHAPAYLDAPFFYPHPAALTYSELQWGGIPLYAPWRALGFSPQLSYQLHALAAVALDFLALLLLLGPAGLGFSPGAAIAGGALFAFGGPRTAMLNHAQNLIGFPLALAVLAVARALRPRSDRERRGALLAAGMLFAWQFLAASYVAWFAAFVALLGLPWVLASRPLRAAAGELVARAPLALATAGALAAAAILPVAASYAAARATHPVPTEELDRYLPTLASWVNPGGGAWLGGGFETWSGLAANPVAWAHALGLGAVTAALVILGLASLRRQPWIWPALGASVLAVLLTLHWPNGWSLWHVIRPWLPGESGLRVVGRLALVLLLPAAIGLAAFWDRVRPRWPAALAILLLALAVVEQGRTFPSYSRRGLLGRVRAIARAIPDDCPSFYYSPETTGEEDRKGHQAEAMWASLIRDIPTANGYSSSGPAGWSLEIPPLAGESDRQALRQRLVDWINWQDYPARELCWVRVEWRPGGGGTARVERLRRDPHALGGKLAS
jgi:hypothetical protein